jgi:pimeloyl-ACP methyl ester carboxylesterase
VKIIKTLFCSSAFAAIATLTGCACVSHPAGPATSAHRSFFYGGGTYTGAPGNELMMGQMYVEKLQPKEVKQPYPLVLIHGAAQTATNWMMTPDGRMGWADHYANQGDVVYMVDQPARGRSAWHPDINGKLRMFTAPQLETSQSGLLGWVIAEARRFTTTHRQNPKHGPGA